MTDYDDAAKGLADHMERLITPRPRAEWHEDMGPVLWWCWQAPAYRITVEKPEMTRELVTPGRWAGEPPYVGTPLKPHADGADVVGYRVGGWPGYHTHWTPLPPMPKEPK